MSGGHDWLHDLFEGFGPVDVRRMFGGAGIFRDGLMFGLVADNVVFLKCDDETVPRFQEAGARQFLYDKGGKTVGMAYWTLPDEALDDPEVVKEWADLAFAAALRGGKAKKKPARAAKPKAPAKKARNSPARRG